MTNSCEPVSTFNKRPFCLGYFESCNFKRVKRKQHILTTTLARERYRFPKSSVLALQLLLKSLNTPADLLSQLLQSISLILRLYACSTSTILIASVQRP